MACDRFLELLSARLDGELSAGEERELEEHLINCPDCRAVGAQLSALQAGFAELEGASAPEGFAQGVMAQIQKPPKPIPLFRRPGFRTAAGLAACLALAVGLYGWSNGPEFRKALPQVREFSAQTDAAASGESDMPRIAAYAAPQAPIPEDGVEEKQEPFWEIEGYSAGASEEMEVTLDRLPEGAEALIPLEATASPRAEGGTAYRGLSREAVGEIGRLAAVQGIPTGVRPAESESILIVLEG